MITHNVRWRSDLKMKRIGNYLVPSVVIYGQFYCKSDYGRKIASNAGNSGGPSADYLGHDRDSKKEREE